MQAQRRFFAKLKNLGRMFGTLVILCLLNGCSREVSDKKLADDFAKHEQIFAEMVRLGLGTDLACHRGPNDTATCSTHAATENFQSLMKVGVQAVYARNDIPQLGNAVYFVVAEYGFVTMSSYSKGIIYSRQALAPTVGSTDDSPQSKYMFKKIEDNWYVFKMP